MGEKNVKAFFGILAMCICAQSLFGEITTIKEITITVIDEKGKPIPRAYVWFNSGGGKVETIETWFFTDKNGKMPIRYYDGADRGHCFVFAKGYEYFEMRSYFSKEEEKAAKKQKKKVFDEKYYKKGIVVKLTPLAERKRIATMGFYARSHSRAEPLSDEGIDEIIRLGIDDQSGKTGALHYRSTNIDVSNLIPLNCRTLGGGRVGDKRKFEITAKEGLVLLEAKGKKETQSILAQEGDTINVKYEGKVYPIKIVSLGFFIGAIIEYDEVLENDVKIQNE